MYLSVEHYEERSLIWGVAIFSGRIWNHLHTNKRNWRCVLNWCSACFCQQGRHGKSVAKYFDELNLTENFCVEVNRRLSASLDIVVVIREAFVKYVYFTCEKYKVYPNFGLENLRKRHRHQKGRVISAVLTSPWGGTA